MYHNSIWTNISICLQFDVCQELRFICCCIHVACLQLRGCFTCVKQFMLSVSFSDCCSHFFVHGGWFDHDGWIMDNLDKIRHIPATVVHGRYDLVCPAKNAWDLHKVCVVHAHTYALHAGSQKHRLVCVLSVIKCSLHRVGRCVHTCCINIYI